MSSFIMRVDCNVLDILCIFSTSLSILPIILLEAFKRLKIIYLFYLFYFLLIILFIYFYFFEKDDTKIATAIVMSTFMWHFITRLPDCKESDVSPKTDIWIIADIF